MGVKRILLLVGDYVEDYQAMVPFQCLQTIGHVVHAVCPGKRAGEQVKTAVHESEGDQTYSERPGHRFTLNASFAGIRPEDYDALVIPGGRAPEYLRLKDSVLDLVRHFFSAGKPVASICRGAQLLAAAGVLEGKACSAASGVSPEVNQAGGCWVDIPAYGAHIEGNLITAPAWPAHPDWLAKFLQVLGSRIEP